MSVEADLRRFVDAFRMEGTDMQTSPAIGRRLRHAGIAAVLLLLPSCISGEIGGFEASVDPTLTPAAPSVPGPGGSSQPVAASRDAQGIQSDFVEGVVLLRPGSPAALQDFLDRYGGTVVSDNTIPAPPPELGITLTEEQRKPTEFVVAVSLAGADLGGLRANARSAGLDQPIAFSSEAGLKTFARLLEARAAGFSAQLDGVAEPQQAVPQTMFSSGERPANLDAFAEPRYAATGNQTNVALAWQFVLAHGIQQRIEIAIIDGGFWLDTQGRARGLDSDFAPGASAIPQWDFVQNDQFADGPNVVNCSGGTNCYWHGTGSAGVAAGIINNGLGYAGTGSLIATPILFNINGVDSNRNWAIRTAVAWGAQVVSMSFGKDCNLACRIYDRDHTPIADAINAGSRTVFVAAAGNGRGSPLAGYDVGDPSFYHPCIIDHVICVGAVGEAPALNPTPFSNFGARVTVFAPTNIPVMSYPPSVGPSSLATTVPEQPQAFGGTSASTPFVAGIAAMMKAINPNLGSDDVARILSETARPGVGQASRVVDALAAVRRAADGIPMVNDRFENNSLEANATNLGAAPPYTQPDLNISSTDRDYFTFAAPGASTATITLNHTEALGPVSVFSFDSLGAHCQPPTLISDVPLPVAAPPLPGRSLMYTVPGGPLRLALKGADINAYDLNIAFAAAAIGPDAYEVNDAVAQARYIYSLKLFNGIAGFGARIDPRATIDATIHAATDVDYYVVRGARILTAEQVFLVASPAVRVYGNESPINLQVYRLGHDGSQGALVANVGGDSCIVEPLEVRLEPDARYLVRVAGGTGKYTLSNSVFGDKRRFPLLVRDRVYEVLHPGEPIEHVVRQPEIYVFTGDPAYEAVRTPDPRAHLQLLDREGRTVAEGVSDERGERLSLASVAKDGIYGIAVAPQAPSTQSPTLALQWEQRPAKRVSGNLVRNPGAEAGDGDLSDWRSAGERPRARSLAYGVDDNQPSPTDPGPHDRGTYLFAGAPDARTSSLAQEIAIDQAWRDAIDRNGVTVDFSAYLGGYRQERDIAEAALTFIGEDQQQLGHIVLPSVGPEERGGKTGLWPTAESAMVPKGTSALIVTIRFSRFDGTANDSYADDIGVMLSEY
jgi:hypothetical protein